MKKDKKPTHGGHRPGSGRPTKYGEETERIAFRVPVSLKEKIVSIVSRLLKKAEVKKEKG